jgi:hypothetical protein
MMKDNMWNHISKILQEALCAEIEEHLDTQDNLDEVYDLMTALAIQVIQQQGVIDYLESFIFEEETDEEETIFPLEDEA